MWQVPKSKWRLGIPIGGLVFLGLGVLGTIGFNVSMEVTSTDAFCTSCHESPSAWVADEWKEKSHFKSASGMVVGCHDCHIPKPFFQKVWVKGTSALSHVSHQVFNPYEDKVEFESKRKELAERVWAKMKATDSRECRHCHDVARMDFDAQSKKAAAMHKRIEKMGRTCIDCHEGLAHNKPK